MRRTGQGVSNRGEQGGGRSNSGRHNVQHSAGRRWHNATWYRGGAMGCNHFMSCSWADGEIMADAASI